MFPTLIYIFSVARIAYHVWILLKSCEKVDVHVSVECVAREGSGCRIWEVWATIVPIYFKRMLGYSLLFVGR